MINVYRRNGIVYKVELSQRAKDLVNKEHAELNEKLAKANKFYMDENTTEEMKAKYNDRLDKLIQEVLGINQLKSMGVHDGI